MAAASWPACQVWAWDSGVGEALLAIKVGEGDRQTSRKVLTGLYQPVLIMASKLNNFCFHKYDLQQCAESAVLFVKFCRLNVVYISS